MKRIPEPGSHIQQTREWEYPFVILESKLKPDMTVIDIGAGASPLPLLLGIFGCKVDCIDNDSYDNNKEYNIGKLWGYHPVFETDNVKYHKIDAEQENIYKKLGKQYDVVMSIGVIEHLKNPKVVKAQFQELVKPGGLVVITYDVPIDLSKADRLDYPCNVIGEVWEDINV